MPPVNTQNPQNDTQNRKLELNEVERIAKQYDFFNKQEEVVVGTASYMKYQEKYKLKGIDLYNEYRNRPKTSADMGENFAKSVEHSPMAKLMEILPLLANKDGRLGENIEARITRTAKPDDEGNSFVDVVIELKNKHLDSLVKIDSKYKLVRPSITICVDVTTNPEKASTKEEALERFCLKPARKASVLCYENKFGVLGLHAPKTVVFKSEDYLARVSQMFGANMTAIPGGGFSIDDEKTFNKEYRKYFLGLLDSASDSARRNILYIQNIHDKPELAKEHKALCDSYQDIIDFIEAYKNTPVTNDK